MMIHQLWFLILSSCLSLLTLQHVGASSLGPQSGYSYPGRGTAAIFKYRIQVYNNFFLTETTPPPEIAGEGISYYYAAYIMDDRPYDVELWQDCSGGVQVAPSPQFPIIFDTANFYNGAATDGSGGLTLSVFYFIFNQTLLESSNLVVVPDPLKAGQGKLNFCLRVNNYAEDGDDPFGQQINFLEIEYDSLNITLPTQAPSPSPSLNPSSVPSFVPSLNPSKSPLPSTIPSLLPSVKPSSNPSKLPSDEPSSNPSVSSYPSLLPTLSPFEPSCPDREGLGPQSTYCYSTTQSASDSGTPICDWNITLVDKLRIVNDTLCPGMFVMSTNYTLEDHHYDVELFEKDCTTAPSGPTNFPLLFDSATNDVNFTSRTNDVELKFIYNQTIIQESSFWTSKKVGGYAEFCIRLSNYLDGSHKGDTDAPYDLEISFLEVVYRIEVDSLTDFNATIDIDRIEATTATESINYEDEIDAFTCNSEFEAIDEIFTQGDFVEICVETAPESKFGVHSIKDLTVSQVNTVANPSYEISHYDYVDNFVDSILAESTCINSNRTNAICKTKIQLMANWFNPETIALGENVLNVEGVLKLDYVGRRLSVDVNLAKVFTTSTNEYSSALARALEEDDTASPHFTLEMHIISNEEDSQSMGVSIGAMFSSLLTFFAGFFLA